MQKFDSSYYSDRFNELFKDDTGKKSDIKSGHVVTVIDTNRFMERIELIGPAYNYQDLLDVVEKDGVTTVLFTVTEGGRSQCFTRPS